jgi:signal transduction histidine kinase
LNDEDESQQSTTFTLFTNEERVLDDAERMIRSLEAVGDGVNALAKAYRRSYDEQRRLLRVSDRVQADLQKTNDQLQEKTRELEAVNERLREANAQKDLLFSIIGHDLRNPFSIVSGYTQYLHNNADRLSRETIKDMAGRAHESAMAVSRLLDTLLEWARVQNDQVQCDRRGTDVDDVITDAISVYEGVATRKNITIKPTGTPHTQVMVDRDMTSTILRNLFNNALKYTPEGGQVGVHVAPPKAAGHLAAVSITDTGNGIPPEVQPSIFTPNAGKATPGTQGEKGLGLGLPICKQLAERQGGDLTVESTPGAGTTFTVYLPTA